MRAFISRATWRRIRARAENGEAYSDLAREFGLKLGSIQCRSTREQWATENRLRRAEATGAAGKTIPSARPAATGVAQKTMKTPPVDCDMRARAAVIEAVQAGDSKAFHSAMGDFGQALISDALAAIPPPTNARDLLTWFEIVRKSKGLDGKSAGAGDGRVIRPIRSIVAGLGRSLPTPEPEEPDDPLDGFEL